MTTLNHKLPAPHLYLYGGLGIIKSLKPTDFMLKDALAFKDLGFHAVGTTIYVGLHALKDKGIMSISTMLMQHKHLGLVLCF